MNAAGQMLLGAALLAALLPGCDAPRKKLPEVTVPDRPYGCVIRGDSAVFTAVLLAAEPELAGDTTARTPGTGRFEWSAGPGFGDPHPGPWQEATPVNGYRITGTLPLPAPGVARYVRLRYGANRSFLRTGRVDTLRAPAR